MILNLTSYSPELRIGYSSFPGTDGRSLLLNFDPPKDSLTAVSDDDDDVACLPACSSEKIRVLKYSIEKQMENNLGKFSASLLT